MLPDNPPQPATGAAVAGQPDCQLDAWLTGSAAKAGRYCDDIYFRESWNQARELLPDPELTLRANTYVLIKPETVATGRVELLLSLIRDRGYLLLDLQPVLLDRHRTRALWQYQLNAAPLATLATVDLIISCGPSAIALLAEEPDARQPGVSASERLSEMKGVSFGTRRPTDLRTLLGGTTRLHSYLHVPDEPADLVRELGIWFDDTARHRVYRTLAGGDGAKIPSRQIAEVIRRLEGDTGVIDLDLDRALDTVARAVPAADGARLRQVRNLLSGEPETATLLDLVRWLSGLTGVPAWDRALIASHLVQRELRSDLRCCREPPRPISRFAAFWRIDILSRPPGGGMRRVLPRSARPSPARRAAEATGGCRRAGHRTEGVTAPDGRFAVLVADQGLGAIAVVGDVMRSLGYRPALITGPASDEQLAAWSKHHDVIEVVDNPYSEQTLQAAARRIPGPLAGLFSCYDGCVLPAALAASALGLPHCDTAALRRARNKYEARLRLREIGVDRVAAALVGLDDDLAAVEQAVGPYPLIVKPVNGIASHLVVKCDSRQELQAALHRLHDSVTDDLAALYSHPIGLGESGHTDPSSEFLVEPFLAGPEYSAELVVSPHGVSRIALLEKLMVDDVSFFETAYLSVEDPAVSERIWGSSKPP